MNAFIDGASYSEKIGRHEFPYVLSYSQINKPISILFIHLFILMSFHNLWLKLQLIYPIYVFIHLSILGTVDKTCIYFTILQSTVYIPLQDLDGGVF